MNLSTPQAKKRFGQHFLHDTRVIERILGALNPKPDDCIIEIGPGPGALTVPLLARVDHLTVVEIDHDVIPYLRQITAGSPKLEIVQADALKVDYGSLAPADQRLRLVGNLPYNISTPLLFHLLDFSDRVIDMHFMLQKEVVDRMCAGPGDNAYGRLSVALAARAEVDYLFHVGPGAFAPPPKVDSAVVRLCPRPPAFEVRNWNAFDRVLAAAFSQRRKRLSNAVKTLLSSAQIEAAGIDPGVRAEELHAADFARLAAQMAD